jgi:hypothetical protein
MVIVEFNHIILLIALVAFGVPVFLILNGFLKSLIKAKTLRNGVGFVLSVGISAGLILFSIYIIGLLNPGHMPLPSDSGLLKLS